VTGAAFSDLDRPPLREADLRRALLVPGSLWTALRVVTQTDSTNADVAADARAGVGEGLIVVAERQVAGRGRLGRVWQSPPRAGITVSVLLRPGAPRLELPAVDAVRFGWLPLLAGVALVQAVRRVAAVDATLKWPNDLMIGDRKLAGILAELVPATAGGHPAVVLGVGLNTTLRADELPHPTATSLALAGARGTDRDPLLRALLRDFADRYIRWRAARGNPDACGLRWAYEEHCSTIGQPVQVLLPGAAGVLSAVAEGIDVDGRLIVVAEGGQRTALAAGDVVHVRPHDATGASSGQWSSPLTPTN
jgi:BirA family transcriptional regulator, biotin operon repressor / biotin---[acetyl-CoA-carboxylase] ligase